MPCEALSKEISSSILCLRNLKLNDEAGISSLPDAELFENLTLMGYNISPNQKFTFQKGQFSHQWKYLIHTIMQCLSPKSTGFNEFSSNIATALVCLATNRVYNFSKMIFDEGEGSGTPTEPHHTPFSTAQQTSPTTYSSPTLPPVTTVNIPSVIPTVPLPTVTPSDTPYLRQYTRRARIAQSSALPPVVDEPASPLRDVSEGKACPTDSGFEADQDKANIAKTSTFPYESTSRVTSLAADEGSMQQKLDELTALCTSLQRQQSEMVSRFEAQELEINSLKARIKLLEDKDKGVADQSGDDALIKERRLDVGEEAVERVSDDTEEMVTVLTSMDATKSTLYIKRKGKETMVESETPKKKKVQEQIDAHVARELEEKMEREDQRMSEQITRDAEAEYDQIPEDLSIGERIELISDLIEDFIPMGSKEEAERLKRKGLRLEQESAKKVKTSEEVPEEVKLPEEVPKEKVKEMMQLVPIEEITRLGGSSASYQFFVDMLKHLDREDLNQFWRLVEESHIIRLAASDKEMELWVKLKRLYEPDVEDQLWTHTQYLMHAPVEWKLYDTCGVHHVTSKDKEIFMLMEKDYPLRKGLAIGMISYKLQVENYSKMANDLILKIYKIASSLRKQDD
nr:synaptobrevin, longin-like domain protein [Tanacetum cinerariifolium]